jgi:hypothetical protein
VRLQPVAVADLRAVAICLRGDFLPVDFRAGFFRVSLFVPFLMSSFHGDARNI